MSCLTKEQVEKFNRAYFNKVLLITGEDFPGRLELVEIAMHADICPVCRKKIIDARKELGEKSVGG